MSKIKIYIISLLLVLPLVVIAQQDPQFSQYLFHGVVINPAYAGSREYVNLNALYRKQWADANGSPTSQLISVDAPLYGNHIGVGLYAYNDKIGAQFQKGAFASFAYRIKVSSQGRLALGVSAGINQIGIDGSKLTTDQPNDPAIPSGRISDLKPDAQVGLYYNTYKFFAGLSMSDIIKNNFGGFRTTPDRKHFYLAAGFVSSLSESFKIRPSFLIKEDFKAPTNIDLTAFLIFKDKIWLGSSYRTRMLNKIDFKDITYAKDAIVLMVELFPIDNLRVGYGYDISLNSYKNFSTHEISIGYNFNSGKSDKVLSPRYF